METYVSGSDVTRRALIDAALTLFGERGYDAVSTREIADHAAANVGSIAYHFGGKPGLRLAAADHLVTTMKGLAGPIFTLPLPPLSQAEAMAALERMTRVFVDFIVAGEDGKLFLNFMLRELIQPGTVLDRVYVEMFKPMHQRFCQLVGMAVGLDPDAEETRVLVFTLIGQCVYFHIGRPVVLRRMDWDGMGKAEADKVTAVLISNLRSILGRYRKPGPEPGA